MLDNYSKILILVIVILILLLIRVWFFPKKNDNQEQNVEGFRNIEPSKVESRQPVFYKSDIPLQKIDYNFKRELGGNTIVSFNDHVKYVNEIFAKLSKGVNKEDYDKYTYHEVEKCQNVFFYVKDYIEKELNKNKVSYKELNYLNDNSKFNIQNERYKLFELRSKENPEIKNMYLIEIIFTLNDAKLDSSFDCKAKVIFKGPEFVPKNFSILEIKSLLDFGTSRFEEPCKNVYAPFEDLKIDFDF